MKNNATRRRVKRTRTLITKRTIKTHEHNMQIDWFSSNSGGDIGSENGLSGDHYMALMGEDVAWFRNFIRMEPARF